MPSRWLVRFAAKGEQLHPPHRWHAAVSRWLDSTDHHAPVKAWSMSQPESHRGNLMLTLGLLTEHAEHRLHHHCRPGADLRLGADVLRVTEHPTLLEHTTWQQLAAATETCEWGLQHHTPTTLRQGQRSTPLPQPSSVLHGLNLRWRHWTGEDRQGDGFDDVWVSDLHVTSRLVRIGEGVYSGIVGTVVYRCSVPDTCARVGPLFALAPYSGVGSKTAWGLGATTIAGAPIAASRPHDHAGSQPS